MQCAWLIGGPTPYREAMTQRLVDAGLAVHDDVAIAPTTEPAQTIVIAYCATPQHWALLESLHGFLARTAVLDQAEPSLYLRALRGGLGVVHIDTKSETIAAVAIAAGHGEAVLPMEIARRLGEAVAPDDIDGHAELDPLEVDLIRSIARGETLVAVAGRYFYSERTLRRRLQSAYLKLGVHDRAGAIRAAERRGLLDT